MAKLGAFAAVKAVVRCGKAARTSGHQGSLVLRSFDDTKVMKNASSESSGNSSSLADAGTVKFSKTGILPELI